MIEQSDQYLPYQNSQRPPESQIKSFSVRAQQQPTKWPPESQVKSFFVKAPHQPCPNSQLYISRDQQYNMLCSDVDQLSASNDQTKLFETPSFSDAPKTKHRVSHRLKVLDPVR